MSDGVEPERPDPGPTEPPASAGDGGKGRPAEFAPEFLHRLRDRDAAALSTFYEAFFDRVYAYVRRMLGEEHLAEDVTQDVFMHIHRSLDTYDPSRDLRPWVFTIATNKVRDFWRSRRWRDTQREASLSDDEGGNSSWAVAEDRGPHGWLENKELAGTLEEAVQSLPESMRTTLILRYFEGLSFEAIGAVIDRNEAAVRKRYSRALEELRRRLMRGAELREGGHA